jgi:hypothetical protein
MNSTRRFTSFVLVLGAGFAAAASAADLRALPAPAPAELAIRGPLATGAPVVEADRTPVSFSWALPGDAPWVAAPAPFVAESREHWLRVPAADLERGIDPAITSAGAVIRLSPLAARAGEARIAIDPARLEISPASGPSRIGGDAAVALAGEAELAAAGLDMPSGTVALRLRDDLGAGPFRLRLAGARESGAAGYLLHVHEPASDVVLALGSDRGAYADGGEAAIEVALSDGGRPLAVDDEVVGLMLSPAGKLETLRFAPIGEGRLRAPFAARGEAGGSGLWQVEVAVTSGLATPRVGGTVRRTARTAFAVALPTAALRGEVAIARRGADGAVALGVPVEVGSPGRYTLRGTLARRDAEGRAVAVARAESSAWLEAGAGQLDLRFDAASLAGAGKGATLELIELELADPGRMGLLERRSPALALNAQ